VRNDARAGLRWAHRPHRRLCALRWGSKMIVQPSQTARPMGISCACIPSKPSAVAGSSPASIAGPGSAGVTARRMSRIVANAISESPSRGYSSTVAWGAIQVPMRTRRPGLEVAVESLAGVRCVALQLLCDRAQPLRLVPRLLGVALPGLEYSDSISCRAAAALVARPVGDHARQVPGLPQVP
jgi:hypothetical protein